MNTNETLGKVRNSITDDNYVMTIKQWRGLGESGIATAIQGIKTAKGEWMAVSLLVLLGEKLNDDNDRSLAADIWYEHGQKVARFGENAYRLSEKQLAVIIKNFMQRTMSTTFNI